MVGQILSKEKFESTYGISLDEYYASLHNVRKTKKMSREELFRWELQELKKDYIHYLISDIDKGFDRELIEMDAYRCYLRLIHEYKDVPNKKEIFREYGFEVNDDLHTLTLVPKKKKEEETEIKK